MSTTTRTEQSVPTGRWSLDTLHSTVGFAVWHSGVSLFRGGLTEFDAELADGTLRGSAEVRSITIDDDTLGGHLLSPDFFDAERFPRVSFTSSSVERDGEVLVVEGELEIRGVRHPIRLEGTIAGPVAGPAGDKLGISLATVVDRTDFGMTWNMELPGGGFILDDEVQLTADLELAKVE